MSNINVVIADDNERIRQNLQEIVSRECEFQKYILDSKPLRKTIVFGFIT